MIRQAGKEEILQMSRRLREEMKRLGYVIGRGRIRRYMHLMGYRAIYPRKSLSRPNKEHKVYPYLLRGVLVKKVVYEK
jgi:putative transposase